MWSRCSSTGDPCRLSRGTLCRHKLLDLAAARYRGADLVPNKELLRKFIRTTGRNEEVVDAKINETQCEHRLPHKTVPKVYNDDPKSTAPLGKQKSEDRACLNA